MGRFVASCAALYFVAWGAYAQTEYPTKPIRFLNPFAPGGSAEVFARMLMQRLQDRWNATAVIEARPGAGGRIATEIAAKAPADGYTFIIVTVGHAVNPSLYNNLNYDTLADFAAVGLVSKSPNVLVVHPSIPVRNAKDLIALAKARPGELNFGSGGVATTAHMAAAMFSSLAGIQATHVPYKGATLALQDLVGGRLEFMLDQIPSSIGFIRNGRLRAVAVTPAKRTPQLADVPTLAESGVPGYDFTAWWLILAPAKTPAAIIGRLNSELRAAAADPAFRERLASFGADPAPALSPAEAGDFLRHEVTRWAKIVKDAGIRVQ
jgi:tripartite-type tricarboxylate transporter receptor subunit TctC